MFINDRWESDRTFSHEWAFMEKPFLGGPRRSVRCGLHFEAAIQQEAAQGHLLNDPVKTLNDLFDKLVPRGAKVFRNAYCALKLLHMNDYVMEKAFVYGVIALSKWLGKERFPKGVYGTWPPPPPDDLAVFVDGGPRMGAPAASSCDPLPK